MAGKKQQAPKPIEEDEEVEGEGWDNVAEVDADSADQPGGRMRDWRDVEKYREMRELRRLVGDEFDFTDVLGEIPIRTAQSARNDVRGKAPPKAAMPPQKGMIQPQKAAGPLQKGVAQPQKGAMQPQKGVAQPQKGMAQPPKAVAQPQKVALASAKTKPKPAATAPVPAPKKPVAKAAAPVKPKPVAKKAGKPKPAAKKPAKAKKK